MGLDCARPCPLASHRRASSDGVAVLFLLEKVRGHVAPRRQANLIALDLGDEAARDVMMMLLVTDATVGADQLDPVTFDAVDRSEVDAICSDHFHMFANIFETAHGQCLLCRPPNASLLPSGARNGCFISSLHRAPEFV